MKAEEANTIRNAHTARRRLKRLFAPRRTDHIPRYEDAECDIGGLLLPALPEGSRHCASRLGRIVQVASIRLIVYPANLLRTDDRKLARTIQCTRAAKPGVFTWTISRRRRVIGDVLPLTTAQLVFSPRDQEHRLRWIPLE